MRGTPAAPVPTAVSPLAAPLSAALPGVPPDWCEGVAGLRTMPAPPGIASDRWAVFHADAERLLWQHGAELHRLGWTAAGLFGLHPAAPAMRPDGRGLAWLLAGGTVLDVGRDAIGMRHGERGARLAYRRPHAQAEAVAAWELLP